MKLKLGMQQGIAVLDIFEDVDVQSVSVLRAGLIKLLQGGKNRVILNLTSATKVTPEFLNEIFKLHAVAAGNGGTLTVAGQNDLVKGALQKLVPAPPIRTFMTVDFALKAFLDAGVSTIAPAAAPAAAAKPAPMAAPQDPLPQIDPNDPHRELKLELAKLERENRVYKAKLQSLSLDEIRKLRFENGIFERQLRAMEEQVQALRKERKKRHSDQVLHTKTGQVELVLEDFLVKEGLLGKK